MSPRRALFLGFAALLLVTVSQAFAAFEAYLTFDGLQGPTRPGTKVQGPAGAIAVWSYKYTPPPPGSKIRLKYEESGGTITILKPVDKLTPILHSAASLRRHYKHATIALFNATDGKQKGVVQRAILTDAAFVSERLVRDPKVFGGVQVEEITFSFQKADWKPTNPQLGAIKFWDKDLKWGKVFPKVEMKGYSK
jgi:type VI protein secretion system component Hcp